jgi:hypothetical protein
VLVIVGFVGFVGYLVSGCVQPRAWTAAKKQSCRQEPDIQAGFAQARLPGSKFPSEFSQCSCGGDPEKTTAPGIRLASKTVHIGWRVHTKFARNEVAQSISEMTAVRIRFIDFINRVPMHVIFPTNPFEIDDQLLASWIHKQMSFSRVIPQHRVHAIPTVFNERV